MAFNRLKQHKEAIDAAQRCTKQHYSFTGCRVEEVAALVALKDFRRVRVRLDQLDRLIESQTIEAKWRLALPLPPDSKDWADSEIERLDADAFAAATYRELMEEGRQ